MLKIGKNSKIYIVAQAQKATGGTEALHQLGSALLNFGLDVKMFYLPKISAPVHKRFEHYNIPFSDRIEDSSKNVIIVPEILEYFKLFNDFPNTQKIIWWLSIDNFYESLFFENKKPIQLIFQVINKLSKILFKEPIVNLSDLSMKFCSNYKLLKNALVSKAHLHLVQSQYAKNHLMKKGFLNVEWLSDYLNDDFLFVDYKSENKGDFIIFNPNKALKFTRRIMSANPKLKMVPIHGMSLSETIGLMKKAKVYIDFGNHPGKDRMGREAALCGCCVITGRRGSASFYDDVSIPEKYKFEDKKENIENIINVIKYCINNYDIATKDFDEYRGIIKKGKSDFLKDVQNIFLMK